MKLQSINYARSNHQNINANQDRNNSRKNNPSFGNLGTGLASFIETQGFMGEFLTNDLFGMMGPRIWQGYGRNSEELGHLNYKAGREETVREMLSGPAYFYVPSLTLGSAAFVAGKFANVTAKGLKTFEPLMKIVNKESAGADVKEKFVDKIIDSAFKDYQNEKAEIDLIKNTMKDLVNEKIGTKKASKIADQALTKLNKANGKFINNTSIVQINGREMKIGTLFADTKNYLENFAKKMPKTTGTNENAAIRKIHKQALKIKNIASILAIGALSAFLIVIPKLYKTGDKFPGKDGLVKDNEEGSKASKPITKEAVNENK